MSILIDLIGLLAILSNVLFALHLWSKVTASPSAGSGTPVVR
jgi:hypothetical protein